MNRNNSILIGNSASIKDGNSIALGAKAQTDKDGAISIGTETRVSQQNGIAIGQCVQSAEKNSITIGSSRNKTGASGSSAVSIGTDGNAGLILLRLETVPELHMKKALQ